MAWETVLTIGYSPVDYTFGYDKKYNYRFYNSYAYEAEVNLSSTKFRIPPNSYYTVPSWVAGSYGLWLSEGDLVQLQRELKNTAPTTPGAFTSPASGTVLKGGETTRVRWGASTDAEGDAIKYDIFSDFWNGSKWVGHTLNGQWTTNLKLSTNYIDFTLVEGFASFGYSKIRFKVQAHDGTTLSPALSYSPEYAISFNKAPTVTLNTTNNRTLYENDTFSIDGTTRDTDSGNVVNVKYQINSGTVRAITTQISNGSSFPFNKVLTFKQNKLFDGASAVTADLAEGTQHVLKVWAEDDQGGKSAEHVRTFYVVPNRPATLTIEPFSTRTDLIDSDTITINGSVSDPDNNTVTVKYKIANGSFTEVYSGGSGSFSFNVTLADLAVGANTITVQAVDSYGAITSKTLSGNKAENSQPLLTSVGRYKLTPPNGTAKGVVLWIQREVGDLVVDAEISMGMNGQAENFQPMTKESTAFVTEGIEEDEFTFDNATDAENILLKLTMTRSSVASDKGIKLISGVLS